MISEDWLEKHLDKWCKKFFQFYDYENSKNVIKKYIEEIDPECIDNSWSYQDILEKCIELNLFKFKFEQEE